MSGLLAPIYTAVLDALGRLTAQRAANLDEIAAARMAKLDALDARLTTARAALLDEITALRMGRLDAAMSSRAPASTALTSATWTALRAANLDQIAAARMAKLDELRALVTDLRGENLDQISADRMAKLDALEARLPAARADLVDLLATGVPALRVQRGVFAAAGSVTIAAVDPAKAFILSVSKGSAGYVAPSGGLMARITGGTTMQVEGWSSAAISFGGGSTNLTARAYSAVLANATTVTADGPCEWQLVEGY